MKKKEFYFDKISGGAVELNFCYPSTLFNTEEFDNLKDYLLNFLNYLQKNIGASLRQGRINFLLAPVSANYQELSNNSSFVSGCNMDNGVFVNGPDDSAFLQIFGHKKYIDFIYDGLTHELLHFYTTGSSSGNKSYLFSSPNTSRIVKGVIGEGLNCYFHYQYFYKHYHHNLELFFKDKIISPIKNSHGMMKNKFIYDWYLFDKYLERNFSINLIQLFKELIVNSREHGYLPYENYEFFLEVMKKKFNITPDSNYIDLLFKEVERDYKRIYEKHGLL